MRGRRQFIRDTALGAGALLFSRYSPFSLGADTQMSDSRIEVLLGEPLGTISPNIYGHFVENLSGVVYDGIWVGENSKVPNVNGIRRELIEEMRKIKAPVVRFPGGCFADSYDWRDGIGPATSVRGEPISGLMAKAASLLPVTSTIPISSEQMNFCISAN